MLTHVNAQGEADMVDVSAKPVVHREAEASGFIHLMPETLELIGNNRVKKGDVISVARLAGIMAAKKTSDLIPLCHNIPIDKVSLSFEVLEKGIKIMAKAITTAKTGIEMEALTAVSIAALSIYDMCKAADKQMKITDIKLEKKSKDEF